MMQAWVDEVRAKPRLAAGLGVVVMLVWVLGLLELDAAQQRAQAEQLRLSEELTSLRAMAGEDAWRQQRDQAFERLAQLRSRAWREESEGRMQAAMQDWLRERSAVHGMPARELSVTVLPPAGAAEPAVATVAAEASATADLRLVRARLVADFQPQGLHALMAEFASHPQSVWVTRLSVRNGARRTLEMEIEAPFIVASARQP